MRDTRLRRGLHRGTTWTEQKGSRIYWCWWTGVGAMGQRVVHRALIGKVKR